MDPVGAPKVAGRDVALEADPNAVPSVALQGVQRGVLTVDLELRPAWGRRMSTPWVHPLDAAPAGSVASVAPTESATERPAAAAGFRPTPPPMIAPARPARTD